ncbi:hemolysin family protein [Natrialbaceae archaeon AArc-T1-2]|uniref:hemolysin family protein n=1 Tax=Natrialbaceae archaeon AArc-T1-2 TaxID=3053904 RepID=UPI00255A8998|nr:hemolysin family protein [Natrialbaceae archaeon AArc-T1-2]WIV68468.1 hemolysin family protein [Natrialbaceae archaeon AArc-T1-2]
MTDVGAVAATSVIDAVSLSVLTAAGVVAVAMLMGVSAFFSSSEIAMFALPKHRLDVFLEEDVPNAAVAKGLLEDPHRLLVTILVGNNVANVAMSSLTTALLGFYVSQGQAVLITTVGVTALVLLFCESAPKSYAVENTESWAMRVARPLQLSEYVFYPFVVVFDVLTRAINKLVGAGTRIESAYVTRSELQELIEAGQRAGAIEADERERLQRIFRFSETHVDEIMVPRPDVYAVELGESLEDAIQTCAYSGHTHLPVYEDSFDTVVGTVNVCELVRERHYGERDPTERSLEDVLEPVVHVPETMPADEVLAELQGSQAHVAVVVDEFGTTEGIVTTEDPTEVVVGEILQPLEQAPIEIIGDRTATIQGEVSIGDVNETLDLELPETTWYDTIAGFVLARIGRRAREGDRVEHDGISVVVEHVTGTRIESVRLVAEEPFTFDEDEIID